MSLNRMCEGSKVDACAFSTFGLVLVVQGAGKEEASLEVFAQLGQRPGLGVRRKQGALSFKL